ncbi:MAG TPA: hypothetical protein VIU61_14485, partial [Kofleriaceae bacterium]
MRIASVACAASVFVIACGRGEPRDATPSATTRATTATTDATIAASTDAATHTTDAATSCPVAQPSLGPGLVVERWPIAATPIVGEPCIDVVRADLASHRLRALSDPKGKPAPDWLTTNKLVAVTNAGMFHANGNPVGMLVDDGVTLAKDHKLFGGYIAFDPRSPDDPAITITGRDCASFDLAALQRRYSSILQANRLIG